MELKKSNDKIYNYKINGEDMKQSMPIIIKDGNIVTNLTAVRIVVSAAQHNNNGLNKINNIYEGKNEHINILKENKIGDSMLFDKEKEEKANDKIPQQ